MTNYLIVAGQANIGIRTNSNEIQSLSYVIFKKDGSIMVDSYHGSPGTTSSDYDYGKIAVLTPFVKKDGSFDDDISILACRGCGIDKPFAETYTNLSGNPYYFSIPVNLTVGEESYLVIGNIAIKE